MNAASLLRPVCSLIAAPLLLFALSIGMPTSADGAAPAAKNVPAKKSVRQRGSNGQRDMKKSSLAKHTKKHHKHKKHHKKHHKNGQKGRRAFNSENGRDQARIAQEGGSRGRDMNQLRRAIR